MEVPPMWHRVCRFVHITCVCKYCATCHIARRGHNARMHRSAINTSGQMELSSHLLLSTMSTQSCAHTSTYMCKHVLVECCAFQIKTLAAQETTFWKNSKLNHWCASFTCAYLVVITYLCKLYNISHTLNAKHIVGECLFVMCFFSHNRFIRCILVGQHSEKLEFMCHEAQSCASPVCNQTPSTPRALSCWPGAAHHTLQYRKLASASFAVSCRLPYLSGTWHLWPQHRWHAWHTR